MTAVGTSLQMGSGVVDVLQCGMTVNQRESGLKDSLDLSVAIVIDMYDLNAEYMIQTAGISHYGMDE